MINHEYKNTEPLAPSQIISTVREIMQIMEKTGLGDESKIKYLDEKKPEVYSSFCNHIRDKFENFHDRYPGIINSVLVHGPKFDIERLEKFVALSVKLHNNEVPELETHVSVSKQLRDEFVLPKLGMNPEEVEEVDLTNINLDEIDWSKTNLKF